MATVEAPQSNPLVKALAIRTGRWPCWHFLCGRCGSVIEWNLEGQMACTTCKLVYEWVKVGKRSQILESTSFTKGDFPVSARYAYPLLGKNTEIYCICGENLMGNKICPRCGLQYWMSLGGTLSTTISPPQMNLVPVASQSSGKAA